MIYFVRAVDSNRIKIGYTGNNPEQRLAQLQTGSPEKLELVGFIDGGVERERQIHADLSEYRMHGEWFDGYAIHAYVIETLYEAEKPFAEPYRALPSRMWTHSYGRDTDTTAMSLCCPCCGSTNVMPSAGATDTCSQFTGACRSHWRLQLEPDHAADTCKAVLVIVSDCRNEETYSRCFGRLPHSRPTGNVIPLPDRESF